MKCPGQDSRYWSGEDVFEADCPQCGHSIEFFKDDSQQKCRKCGHRMLNPRMDFGCASYCPHAEQCLGSMPPELLATQGDLFRDRVAVAMRNHFGADARRIQHALDVADHAEVIGKDLKDGDMMVIMAAALLHDIGSTKENGERQDNASAAGHRHIECPSVAREILTGLKARVELIEEVCDIIGHDHTPDREETTNFKVVYDAELIVNMTQLYRDRPPSREQLGHLVASSFLTKAGAVRAKQVLTKFISS